MGHDRLSASFFSIEAVAYESGSRRSVIYILIFCFCYGEPGYNEYGQLGRGITCEGLQRACILNAYAKFLDEAPELVKITKVSCGEYHTAAISEEGEV